MSYCQWSCDDYQCDLYCYEHGAYGWATHVASARYAFKTPIHAPVPVDDIPKWLDRKERIDEMCREAVLEPIGLPCDGQTFYDPTLEDFRARVAGLIAMGYRAPEDLVKRIDSEIEDAK